MASALRFRVVSDASPIYLGQRISLPALGLSSAASGNSETVLEMLVVTFFLLSLSAAAKAQTVPDLNTTAYLGRWYQVYSDLLVEATFENASYCDTADYGLNANGSISVLNRERQYGVDGPERRILGWAAQDNATSAPGQLTVHLQTTWFGAPYWVYELGPVKDGLYEYSIVSDPLKATLFVLARNVSEFFATWNANVTATLKNLGFTGLFNTPLVTIQDNCTYWD
jgi:apolipoprotein D and lipocalin family protein